MVCSVLRHIFLKLENEHFETLKVKGKQTEYPFNGQGTSKNEFDWFSMDVVETNGRTIGTMLTRRLPEAATFIAAQNGPGEMHFSPNKQETKTSFGRIDGIHPA